MRTLALILLLLPGLTCLAEESARVFSVPARASAGKIARDLKAQGFIDSELLFKAGVLLSGSRGKLKAGEYEIPAGATWWGILSIIKSGKSMTHPFVVPEGYSLGQIAQVLSSKGLANPLVFMALAKNIEIARKLSVTASPDLEGYLFPDTYQIPRGYGEERILAMMVGRFHEKVPSDLLGKGRAKGMSPHQVLSLASIVEREVRADAERPKVASVFYNRMRQDKRLESCATVRYAMGKFEGPLLSEDLQFRSPYNTYRHRGLPPGPICSPGLKSIQAAAEPALTDFLFFVVSKNGEHVFSRTFDEHKRAKFRYKAKVRAGVIEQ
jgi:UPF0755 protein